MPPQELLLSKGVVALVTLEWFLSRVGEDVRLEVSLRAGGIVALVTLVAFLPFVRLPVQLEMVPVHKGTDTQTHLPRDTQLALQ